MPEKDRDIAATAAPSASRSDQGAPDPLPSWNDGEAKKRIVDFVEAVTKQDSCTFVQPSERIATFDLDGTLWPEHPMYAQLAFAIDFFFRNHAAAYPEVGSLLQRVKAGLSDLHQVFANIANLVRHQLDLDEYIKAVRSWLDKDKHPDFDHLYKDLAYQPMRELLCYLHSRQFSNYLVTGAGIEFLRAFSDSLFKIPPERVIGSTTKTEFVVDSSGQAAMKLLPWPEFIDNGKRKAESINEFIGRRPLAAFGNSDSDQQMLEWTASGDGLRLMALVHHTDAEREYRYDSNTFFGHLDSALAEAQRRSWLVIDMAKDWNTIFAFGPVTRIKRTI